MPPWHQAAQRSVLCTAWPVSSAQGRGEMKQCVPRSLLQSGDWTAQGAWAHVINNFYSSTVLQSVWCCSQSWGFGNQICHTTEAEQWLKFFIELDSKANWKKSAFCIRFFFSKMKQTSENTLEISCLYQHLKSVDRKKKERSALFFQF